MTVPRPFLLSLHPARALFATMRRAVAPGRLLARLQRFRVAAAEREVARLVDRDAPKGPSAPRGRGGRHFV